MKVLKQILDKAGLSPTSRFKVPSNSELGEFHIIEVFSDGHLECDCVAGNYKQPCRHIKTVKNHLSKCHQPQKKKNSIEKKA
ncbi:hypothetical protein KKF82_04505 [Patescibacteria group bacterium]|nr:hypothetical protein [Patescibacteria group bacterium]